MKAISIRQPWAWAILRAGKRIENRPRNWKYRGPILLHASSGCTTAEWNHAAMEIRSIQQRANPILRGYPMPSPMTAPKGGIVGRANVVGCVHESEKHLLVESDKHWFFGPWGIVLDSVEPLPFTPCKGALGLFEIDDAIVPNYSAASSAG